MQTPFQLTFHSPVEPSPALAEHLQLRADKLDQLYDKVTSCHVVVGLAGHHREHDNRFTVTIHVGLPGHELLVNHIPKDHHKPTTALESADLAFDDAERQLEDWASRRRDNRRAPHVGNLHAGEK
jgi:ribosome-associated translation inhibitor RaiA